MNLTRNIRRNLRRLYPLAAAPMLGLLAAAGPVGETPPDPDSSKGVSDDSGWTELEPSADSRLVYVSSSDGSDSNSGLSPEEPKKTIAEGYRLLRDGRPDWLLLKRGDEFHESFGHWKKSGRSPAERMVVTTYGNDVERPVLLTGTATAFTRTGGGGSPPSIENLALVGFRIHPQNYNGSNGDAIGLWWYGKGANILIEDVYFDKCGTGLAIQQDNGRIENVQIRRCIIADAYGQYGHKQGIYTWGVDGLLIEECLWDNNGAPNDIFRRNLYIGTDCTDVVFKGNISTRSASDGIQLRPGGVIEDNLFALNPLGLLLGGGDYDPNTHINGVTGVVRNNVIINSTDIAPDVQRGHGITIENIGELGAIVEGNIIAHKLTNTEADAITLGVRSYGAGVGCNNVVVRNNIVYDWRGALDIQEPTNGRAQQGHVVENNQFQDIAAGSPSQLVMAHGLSGDRAAFSGNVYHSERSASSWFSIDDDWASYSQWLNESGEQDSLVQEMTYLDPDRDLASYNASLGGPADPLAFLAECKKQSRFNWRPEYTAAAVNQYIREGFTIAPRSSRGPSRNVTLGARSILRSKR